MIKIMNKYLVKFVDINGTPLTEKQTYNFDNAYFEFNHAERIVDTLNWSYNKESGEYEIWSNSTNTQIVVATIWGYADDETMFRIIAREFVFDYCPDKPAKKVK